MSTTAATPGTKPDDLLVTLGITIVCPAENFKAVEAASRKMVANLLETASRSVQRSKKPCNLHDADVVEGGGEFSLTLNVAIKDQGDKEG